MRRWLIVLVALGVPAGLVYLYAVPPVAGSLYPQCLLHAVTGLHCPGCGATRCVHALLHGNLAQAVAYNGLFLIALPLLVAFYVRQGVAVLRGRPPRVRRLPGWVLYTLVTVVVLFGILRNLPISPFSLLAPHEL
jgi:hypothetical protein